MSFGTIAVIWTREMDERLCDLIAQDEWTFGEIARMMNLSSRDMVTSRWRRLVAQMGWQASWPTPAGPGSHQFRGEKKTPALTR